MPRARRWIFRVATFSLGMLLGLGFAELILRASGFQPWRYRGVVAREPVMHEPDPVLGWRAKPGRYLVPPYQPGSLPIRVTFLPDGSRATGAADQASPGTRVVFVGASYTQGWAVADHETFAWGIQQRFPSLRVQNYGTGGYSTYQSLLMLQRILEDSDPPALVVYPFYPQILPRNVASPEWLHMLSSFSRRGTVETPYCTLDADGRLVTHPPVRYPEWPLREHLALVSSVQRVYSRYDGQGRAEQAIPVTDALLEAMDGVAREAGSQLTVVFLTFPAQMKTHYTRFLTERGIDFADCAYDLGPAMRVAGDAHPNARMHARWARCLAEVLRVRLDLE